MKPSIRLFNIPFILALLFVACAATPQVLQAAVAEPAQSPHNAFSKEGREDLAGPLREQGEIRLLVGLQTPAEIAATGDPTPDSVKQAVVSARQSRLLQRLAGYNVRNVKQLRNHQFIALTADAATVKALLADPEVSSITEDRPHYPVLFDTPIITRADKAWAAGYKGAGQTVAIIDSGVDKTHPFFSGKVVAEACFFTPHGSNVSYCPGGATQSFVSGSGAPCADSALGCWHGTHVAGIAAGRYGVLTSSTGGIAPDATIIAIQVFQRQCAGANCSIVAYDSDLLAALDYVYSLRDTYNIASINMSLGGDVYTAACDNSFPAYKNVIASLRTANIATVIAAGNDGDAGALSTPACVSNSISVGSTTKQNTISSFSNSASFLSLLAPGSSVTSSVPGGYGTASGTSMATPHVTGAWAVLKSAKPTATVSELLADLQNGGLPITDIRNGITKSLIQIGYDGTTPGALGLVLGHGNVPPTIALTSPTNGGSFVAPASITLTASVADSDGSIAKVEFFQGTTKIGEAPAAGPYTFVWTNVTVGSYALTARVTDNLGGTNTSGSVSITVAAAAEVTGGGPANGGFETPVLGGASYQYRPTGGSWTFSGGAGLQSNASVWSAASAPEGQQTAFLQNTSQISQSFNLAAGSYTVSFYAARRPYGGVQPVQVSIDGAAIGAPITPTGNSFAVYTTTSFNVATAGAHTLQFSGTNGTGDNSTFIDGVVVTAGATTGPGLANSGFETPALPGASYQYTPTGGSWTFSGGAGLQSNGSAWGAAASAPEGQQTAFLQNTSQISQSFNLAAGSYTVSFYAARRPYGGVQPVQVSIDGAAIGAPITPTGNSFAVYTTTSFNVATAGAHTLQFSGTNGTGDNSTFIDGVVVTAGATTGPGLANSGFETPALPGASYQYTPTGGSWTFSGGAGLQSNGSAWGAAASAPEGQQTAFLQNISQISQSFNLAAGSYTVSFYAARRPYGGVQPIQVSIDGAAIGAPITPTGNSFAVYTTTSFNVATAGAHTLQFSGTNGTGDNSTFIDAVAVTPPTEVNTPPSIALASVASGFSSPVGIENARDASGRLFIVQQTGQIQIVTAGQVLPTPFLNIASLIVSGGEQGLLGLAFHPNYSTNGYFYVNYTRQGDGATVIARYQRSPDLNIADPASALILLTIPQPYVNHNGGQLRFGPDGYLYIGMGDGGSANDPENRAQNLGMLLGKMLRIDVNNSSPPLRPFYAIPAGNPFQNEIWALGLRNPWRFSFDRAIGDLLIADVGQGEREEINFQPAGTGAGANYGWRVLEGTSCTGLGGGPPCTDSGFTPPILEYTHDLGCSVTGGYRYRGAAYPALTGYYFYGDFCSGRMWEAAKSGGGLWSTTELPSAGFNISTFGEDEAGEIYVAGYNTGVIYRISAL